MAFFPKGEGKDWRKNNQTNEVTDSQALDGIVGKAGKKVRYQDFNMATIVGGRKITGRGWLKTKGGVLGRTGKIQIKGSAIWGCRNGGKGCHNQLRAKTGGNPREERQDARGGVVNLHIRKQWLTRQW